MEELKGTERCRARNKGVLRKMVAFSPDGCLFLLLCVGCAHHLLSAVRCETGWRTEIGHQPDNSSYFGHPTSSYQSPYRLQAHSYVYIEQGSDYVQGRRPGILTIHDDTRTNEVESLGDELVRDEYGGEPLLVGHSHNPYGNSVKMSELEGFSKQRDQPTGGNESRGKRGVLHLYNMISCATGCDPISYKGYGCYCGFLGSGRALDGIDRCCKIHDHCYEDLFCPIFTVYFQPYLWRCHQGQPQCALENYSTRHQFINGCAAKLCECDRQLAMCLQRHACPRRRAICRSSPLRLLQNLLMAR